MRVVVLLLLLLGAQFSLTAFAPAGAGKAWLLWPFAADIRPLLAGIGGLPQESGSVITPFLAGIAGLAFLAAALALFGRGVPPAWWVPLVLVAVAASATLHLLYFGRWMAIPLLVDAAILWGVLAQHWSVAGLRGI